MLRKFAKMLDSIKYESLPGETVRKTKVALKNYIGGSLPGVDAPLTAAEKKFWQEQGYDSGECSVLGMKEKLPAIAAATVNAAMGEIFLSEDMHVPTSSHPGMLVIPVAVAIGEKYHADGKKLIEAIVAGYEAMGRIGNVLLKDGFADNGLRPASVLAPFGGAVAAAKVMGLGEEGIFRAMTIAGNFSGGVMEFVYAGTDDICIQNSFGAVSSVFAAELAKNGVQGAPTILDGRFGLGMAFNDEKCSWDGLLKKRDQYIIDTTVVKKYPGCGYVQCTARAADEMIHECSIHAEKIDHITIGVCHACAVWPGCDNPGPFNGPISAMMSHQFMTASAILRGTIDVDVVLDYQDPHLTALAGKAKVYVDEEIDKSGKMGSRITVYYADGSCTSYKVDQPRFMTDEEVDQRLRSYGKKYFSDHRMGELVRIIEKLEQLTDVKEFTVLTTKEGEEK